MTVLKQWEDRLKPFFSQGFRIIGEIPITYEQIIEMADAVKEVITRKGMGKATETLFTEFPHLMLVFMSGFSAYNTEQNYWSAFGNLFGLKAVPLFNQGWHRKYIQTAQQEGLQVFDGLDDRNFYVKTIRFQGGIPAHSLPDYFERMVLPAVKRQELRVLPPDKALAYLIDHVYFVDSPVLDFLRHSAVLGLEFFTESCRLARYAEEHQGEILPADQVDLPAYVYDAFCTFYENQTDQAFRWHKPFLQASPYSDDAAVILVLPAQDIPLEMAVVELTWQVTWPGQLTPIEKVCPTSWGGENVYLSILGTPADIKVVLRSRAGMEEEWSERRQWRLPLLPPDGGSPLLAFRSDRVQIPVTRALPADIVYLITPRDSQLVFDGDARKVEECVDLVGSWKDWQIDAWDLRNAFSIQVKRGDQFLGGITPIQGLLELPQLTGGHPFMFQDHPGLPLYTTGIPAISIPFSGRAARQASHSDWTICLRSVGVTEPLIDRSVALESYKDALTSEDGKLLFPLTLLLGDKPAGVYDIHVSGPFNLRADFRVRLWPQLIPVGLEKGLIAPTYPPGPVEFFLRIPGEASIELSASSDAVSYKKAAAGWQVTAGPDLNRVKLDLLFPTKGTEFARVPVTIPLPRVLWALITESDTGTIQWSQGIIHRTLDRLMQAGSSALQVEMYGLEDLLDSLRLQLVDTDDREQVLQEAHLSRTDYQKGWLRASLDPFTGSLNQIGSAAEFILCYTPPKGAPPIRFTLMEVSRGVEVKDVRLAMVDEINWKLTWREDHPLKNRRVLVRAPWEPWMATWEYKLPDAARGEYLLRDIALPPSEYEVYFYVSPTWENPYSEPPEGATRHILQLCTPEERLAQINPGMTSNEQFKALVESACIYHSLGDAGNRDEKLSDSAKHLIHLSDLNLLVGTLGWMEKVPVDPNIRSFFFNAMFFPQLVETILKNHKLNDPALQRYLRYARKVKNIPANSAKYLLSVIDEPVVVYSCLSHLFYKKDADLVSIIVSMIRNSRLTKQDALELLSADPAWAIEGLSSIKSESFSDALIAVLLPILGKNPDFQSDSRLPDLIKRAIPFEEDSQILRGYLTILMDMLVPEIWDILMVCVVNHKITDQEVIALLGHSHRLAYMALKTAPQHEEHRRWIEKLEESFPNLVGTIKVGSRLNTPLGDALVEQILSVSDQLLEKTRLGDLKIKINIAAGDVRDCVYAQLDFTAMKIKLGYPMIWRCSQCGFIHPDQRSVMRHATDEHRHMPVTFSQVKPPLSFEMDDVSIINDQMKPDTI